MSGSNPDLTKSSASETTIAEDDGFPPRNYADLVVHNGQVITVDDDKINNDPGTIADGLVVRDGEILEVTEGTEYERWIGSETTVIDLDGRTVLPGIIDAHSHLQQYSARMIGPAVAPESYDRNMVTVTGSFDTVTELKDEISDIIERKTEELDEGEWVLIMPNNYEVLYSKIPDRFEKYTSLENTDRVSDYHTMAQYDDLQELGSEIIAQDLLDKDDLDKMAPDNPILLMAHPHYLPNEAAYEWFEEEYGNRPGENETVNLYRALMFDVLLEGNTEKIADVIRYGQEVYLMNGVTTYATHVYPLTALDAFIQLDRDDEVRPRIAYGQSNFYFLNPEMAKYHKRLHRRAGFGSEFLWCGGVSLGGMDGGPPAIATTLDAPEEVKSREHHLRIQEGAPEREALEVIAERGARFATSTHALGDKTLDESIQAIIDGSKRGGLSDEEIRERNHGLDHGGMYPRPDHVDICKKYNIRLTLNVWEAWRILHLAGMLDDYPAEERERAKNWLAAAKTALDNDLIVGLHGKELENPFKYIAMFVTREVNGDPVTPEQAIDRVKALKMATTWNADYVLKGDELGSLEQGKRADFVVTSDDFLSVPDDELADIQSLLTVVDGEIEFQAEGF